MPGRSLSFDATIGVEVKGETWSCVEIPGSVEFFGTGKSVRVDARIDDLEFTNVGAMPTGSGGHMISVSASARRRLGKELGEAVHVVVSPAS